jgi:gliding motility-associated protein GldE
LDPDSAYHFLLNTLLTAQLSANSLVVLGILIVILLILSAIISGSEVALFSLSANDINHLKTKERPSYQTVLRLLENPKRLLATILIGNNFINIAVIISANLFFKEVLNVQALFPGLAASMLPTVDVLLQIVVVTIFLVLFGEVLPKVYATQNNLTMSVYTAPFIYFIHKLVAPLSHFLVNSTHFIEHRLASKNKKELSNEDLEHAIELTVGHTATKEEKNIFKGILKFGEITVKQIMRTRLDVSALDYRWPHNMVKKQVRETGFSRLPVYEESLDQIKGSLYTKDLLSFTSNTDHDWHALIRPAYFVHESKLIEDLLHEFQLKRIHMAIVVDEFGGTSGLVTLEDIMEEIIGDIRDEFDDDELVMKKIDDSNYIFEGKTLINDFCKVLAIPTELFETVRGESDSLAGLVLEIAGKFPTTADVYRFAHFEFRVIQLDKRRLQKIKVSLHPNESTDSH